MTNLIPTPPLAEIQAAFLEILPRIELHSVIYFRHIRCHQRRADCIAEAVAVAWKWTLAAFRRGKDVRHFVSVLASLAARTVRSGRRLCGQERSQDVFSPSAQQRHGFGVQALAGHHNGISANLVQDALADNSVSPPPEQAHFRIEFPRWRRRHARRDRCIIDLLMSGERTLDVAQLHGLSPARISQLRRELQDDWLRFCGEVVTGGA